MSYTPHYKIGKGAFGSVYKVVDQNGKVFAAKSIKKRSSTSSRFENQKNIIKNEITSMRLLLNH